MIKKLIQLSSLGGISGFEFQITSAIQELMAPYFDEISADKMGNVIGIKRSRQKNAKKVMLEAHIDGIGLMVKDIDEKGFITFVNIGGVDTRILPSAEVLVCGKKDLYGIIGAKPPHLQKEGEAEKPIKIEDMAIDVGLPAQTVREVISAGDMITFYEPGKKLCGKRVSGKYLDDRAGLLSLLICMENIKEQALPFDLYVLASVQEEVGLRGAMVGTYQIQPDCAFVVDVCHGDTPDASGDNVFKLGSGTVISVGPNIHPFLSSLATDLAKEKKITYSIEVSGGDTGTNAWAVQVSRSGVPTLLLSIPLRYMHTTVETVDMKDMEATGVLLAHLLMSGELEEFLCTY